MITTNDFDLPKRLHILLNLQNSSCSFGYVVTSKQCCPHVLLQIQKMPPNSQMEETKVQYPENVLFDCLHNQVNTKMECQLSRLHSWAHPGSSCTGKDAEMELMLEAN